jgi:hypothetical protein
MKNYLKSLIVIPFALLASCSSDDNGGSSTNSGNGAKVFTNLTFSPDNPYFSTDGSMTAPVSETQATPIVNKIDITFIYNYDYFEPGFFDPVARSQEWYWDEYTKTFLSTAVETRFYSTTVTKAEFDAAADDDSLIANYFAESTTVLAPHSIFPTGSCIGGRESDSPTSVLLSVGKVFAFKNVSSGKRGLIYIRTNQSTGWPIAVLDTNTKVDIIREE